MKPSRSVMPQREPVAIERRKPLTRRETIELAVRQCGSCGCGCGEKLDALREGVTDEHRIPLEMGGTNDLTNRELWRTPCAKRKTAKADQPAIAKVKRIEKREAGERKPSRIKSRGFGKQKRTIPRRPFPGAKARSPRPE